MEKKRSTNFSSFETNLLIKLVEDKKHVLDPQKPNAMKHGAWKEITTNFNEHKQIKTYRDEKALKKKYSNLKCDAKNWPTLRAEALSKLSNLETYGKAPLKPEKPHSSETTIKPVTVKENGFASPHSPKVNGQQSQEIPANQKDTSDSEASIDETDTSSTSRGLLFFDEQSEHMFNKLSEQRMKDFEEKAKRKMEILESEHQEKMKFLKFTHEMEMKRVEIEQERYTQELDFVSHQITFKNQIRMRHKDPNKDSK